MTDLVFVNLSRRIGDGLSLNQLSPWQDQRRHERGVEAETRARSVRGVTVGMYRGEVHHAACSTDVRVFWPLSAGDRGCLDRSRKATGNLDRQVEKREWKKNEAARGLPCESGKSFFLHLYCFFYTGRAPVSVFPSRTCGALWWPWCWSNHPCICYCDYRESAMAIDAKILKYGDESARQVVKKYHITSSRAPSCGRRANLVMIHGGAWRDPNNTCADFDQFAEYFDEFCNNAGGEVVVYSVDYELSSEQRGRFPDVIVEVLRALDTVRRDAGDAADFCVCGHSVGCTFITQLFEHARILEAADAPPALRAAAAELQLPRITRAVFLDGIYDIAALLQEYPSYAFFVRDEFGTEQRAVELCNSVGRPGCPPVYATLERVLVVHSRGDELLSLRQPDTFVRWLDAAGVASGRVEKVYADFGLHNHVYVNKTVAELVYKTV